MAPKIDKMPPEISGIPIRDAIAMREYLLYLRETVNFALETVEKQLKTE